VTDLAGPRASVEDALEVVTSAQPKQLRISNRAHAVRYLVASDAVACVTSLAIFGTGRPVDLVLPVVTLGCFAAFRLYRRRLSLSVLDDLPYVAASAAAGVGAELAVYATVHDASAPNVILAGGALLMLLVVGRILAYAVIRYDRCNRYARRLCLMVGAGHVGIRLAQTLQQHKEYGLDPIGFVDSDPRIEQGERLPVPLLGRYEDLSEIIEDFNVDTVITAFGSARETDLVNVLRSCDRSDCDMYQIPRLFELNHTTRDMDHVWGVPLVHSRRGTFRGRSRRMKRAFDAVVSGLALILLSPVMAMCALAVRFETGPKVLFRQQRVGIDGRRFELLKFRSLKTGDETESQSTWSIATDDRIGPVGRFLRATSLDELPQLLNILMGHMSLVGPRPERTIFVDKFNKVVPRYMARHRVPVGLTGWAQVHGLRGDTSIEDRAIFDNFYIENWSMWLDIKIIIRTIGQVFRQTGA
jgi:exopolysaccharide biosynthesis polyprenyl glycosylphosphotransferase